MKKTMARDLKILYVSAAFIAPPHTGCMIRTMNVARKLKDCGRVTVLGVAGRLDEKSMETARQEFDSVHFVKLKDYSEYGGGLGNFIKKFHMHWPWSEGRKVNKKDQQLFHELAAEHDIVWFHTLGAANPFDFENLPKSVMDLDDLNHCKYTLRFGQDKTFRLRMSAMVQAWKWKKREFESLEKYDRLVVCSEDDRELLGGSEKIHVIPNGFTKPQVKPEWKKPDELRIGFIGTLGYGPNRDGLIWFRDNIWPLIRKQKPKMTLRIVGSPPPEKDKVLAEGFESLGFIADPTDEFQTWSAMIVPLLFGGGTRIKILESFSKMCPVISTTPGAHGIQAEHGKNILLSDDIQEFAQYCLELSDYPEKGKEIAEAGWQLFVEKYSWEIIGKAIENVISNLKKH